MNEIVSEGLSQVPLKAEEQVIDSVKGRRKCPGVPWTVSRNPSRWGVGGTSGWQSRCEITAHVQFSEVGIKAT